MKSSTSQSKQSLCKELKFISFNATNISIILQFKTYESCEKESCKNSTGYSCMAGSVIPSTGEIGVACCKDCFPASAKIILKNGKTVTMSELQIGDAVKSGELTFFII